MKLWKFYPDHSTYLNGSQILNLIQMPESFVFSRLLRFMENKLQMNVR